MFGANSVSATTTTRYLFPGNANATAQTNVLQFRAAISGTARNMRVHQDGAGNGNAVVYTLRVNGTPTALAVSMASTADDGSDLVDGIAIAPNDLIDIEVTKAASLGSSPNDVYCTIEID